MPSWRFSRSSASSSRDVDNDAPLPPRYSHLPSVEEGRPLSPSEVESPSSYGYHVYHAASQSVTSLESNITAPTYATYDNADNRSISPSTITVSNPPRYSRLLYPSAAVTNGQGEARNGEYTFGIYGGNRLDPWAYLHLYDPEVPKSKSSRKRKYPRFSNQNKMLGNVELSLNSSQTIKSIKLILKGTIESSKTRTAFRHVGDSPTVFLEHTYVLWDRKFGDPRNLVHDPSGRPSGRKYDGKFTGNWIFPFSIPFPSHVDLSTLQAAYPDDCDGPIRFLPELLEKESPISPFHVDETPNRPRGVSFLDIEADGSPHITPFDTRSRYRPSEKGRPVSPQDEGYPPPGAVYFSPISPTTPPSSSGAASPEPYMLGQLPGLDPLRPSKGSSSRLDSSPLPPFKAADMTSEKKGPGVHQLNRPSYACNDGNALPQSFFERDIIATVHYELTLSITHGMFGSESRVGTKVAYAPVTLPESMLPRRRIACREKKLPPNPKLDPDGWKQLSPVSIKGTYLHHKSLTVHYTMYLAKPLSFPRGSVIPCFLSVACSDSEALDLFAEPRTPCVRLKRLICSIPNGKADRPPSSGSKPKRSGSTDLQPFAIETENGESLKDNIFGGIDPTYNYDETEVGKGALWCVPASFDQEPNRRTLYGEIHLPGNLQPTCKFQWFSILYRVELMAPMVNAYTFVPEAHAGASPSRKGKGKGLGGWDGEHVYASQFVEITTDVRKDDPLPVSFVKE